jgi:glycine/D-amino acid oxidase-like deaminating enzyme
MSQPHYDICIIGAGPAGLAALSAIREPYSIDKLSPFQAERASRHSRARHNELSVCIIDSARPMEVWRSNFATLRIKHLRSPAMAHPNNFDMNGLLEFAKTSGRDKKEIFNSGCEEVKQLTTSGETQVGLWSLPSTKLFLDFCDDMVQKLPHEFLQGRVTNLDKQNDGEYLVEYSDGAARFPITARNVILATGMVGAQVLPTELKGCPALSWRDDGAFPAPSAQKEKPQRVLVVGGGLTAVQAALRVVEDGHYCVLCSRREIQSKHFDLPLKWFDQRSTNKCMFSFHNLKR